MPHPRPTGWYAVAFSSELVAGRVVGRTLFGGRHALYRTEAGVPALVAGTCPHLGADLSRGRVCGEHLRCPFHGFEFDRDGTCVATPYGGSPPKARARTLPVLEQNGLVLAWWDEAGRGPAWAPEAAPDAGWTPPRGEVFELTSHPIDTTENSVDIGHFRVVHGFSDVEPIGRLETDGPRLHARYAITHHLGPARFRIHFDVTAWGLGYSFVQVETPGLGVPSRLWVLATPAAPGRIELRLAASGPTGLRGGAALGRLVRAASLRLLVHDATQDFEIWNHRDHVARPALHRHDGPVGPYRAWARQFDPGSALEPLAEAS